MFFIRFTRAVRENSAAFKHRKAPGGTLKPLMEISKTDLLKIINYLNDATRLYEALPMQSMKSRAHMIRRLTDKLKSRCTNAKK